MEEIKAISQIQLDSQGNKTDLLLQHFTDLIINKTLPPHYVFPNENTMCELLSIGRGTLREVYKVLEERLDNPIDSYTSKIMQDSDKKAEDKILEKVAEECGEVLLAAKNDENLVYESVDLIFHTLLILVYKGIEIDEIFEEFARRRH